jgi:hypothetical protein
MNRFHAKMNQVSINAMNYLALGNEIYWQQIDGLYVRSNGKSERITMDSVDNDDDFEFYANLAYHLTQITLLAQERQQQLTAKVK